MPSGPQNTQKPRKSRFGGFVVWIFTTSHFGPPDSIRRRVRRPLSRGGGWPKIFRAGQTGRKAIYQAVWSFPRRERGQGEGRFRTKRFCLAREMPSATQNTQKDPKMALWRRRPGDSFRATRQHSTTRGEALSRGGAWPRLSEPARRAGRPFTRLSGLSRRGREGRGEAAFARNASARL